MENINPIAYLENTYNLRLKKAGRNEWAGPCPWCGGDDRFHVWERGNYWCRPGPGHCGAEGWVDKLAGKAGPTPEQLLEWRVARLEQKQREQEERLTRLEQMAQCQDHLQYHEGLTDEAMEYWLREGMTEESIERYLLGYCQRCPTYPRSPSYTIPIVNGGKLQNIRHRLERPNKGGKYRPHMAGLGIQLFNADLLAEQQASVLVVEGEKKSIILTQAGFDAVGITGKRSFKREWLERFANIPTVYVGLDPDATESAERLAGFFGGRGRVVDFPCKPDDMITRFGAGARDIEACLRWARRC
jgi:hypothetical protein